MRGFVIAAILFASPAFAHHEVVVATSMMPLVLGMSVIVLAGGAAFRKRLAGWLLKRRG